MAMKFNKDLGQHILKNPGIVDKIIDRAGIKPTDTVLEIGSGTGNLTLKLLTKAKRVICYEYDKKLAAELIKRVKQAGLSYKMKLFIGDCMKSDFPPFDLCVSNIPYQISSVLIFKLFNYNFRAAILMVQHEFAMRLVAKPNSPAYSRLSVSSQLFSKVDYCFKVSKKNFNPPPKVESAVINIKKRLDQPKIDISEFTNFLKICFKRKNKTLSSVFSDNSVLKHVNISKENLPDLLQDFSTYRANKLEIEDFLQLFLSFKQKKVIFAKL
ncbi:dimethyladenosine transferase [Pseudoloma neurophilia]|uniref:rRNA adenine N(6)-methyltransferase n=1 Tax=Pseudoloma neurophilia TaxID=146866 RepID=A0A0R0M568_9MICR|nr:dimethyladenosine transferase [Pseudoloma neurophilia]